MEKTELGVRLALAREERGFSRRELAALAGLSAKRGAIDVTEIETGTVKAPSPKRLVAISKALRVSMEWLLGDGPRAVPALPKRKRPEAA